MNISLKNQCKGLSIVKLLIVFIIVLKNGTRMDGFMNISKIEICRFKINESSQWTEYTPEQIEFFRFEDGTMFQSLELAIDDVTPELRFVEVLVRGKVSLFLADDVFLVRKNNDSLYPLIVTEGYFTDENGRKGILENKKYIGILNYFMADCSEIRQKINRSELNEKGLTSLVVSYNQCSGEEFTESKSSIPFSLFRFSSIIGLSYKAHDIWESSRTQLYPNGEYVGLVPQIGLELDWSSPRIAKNLFVRIYPNIQYCNINGTSFQGVVSRGSQYDLKLSYGLLNLPIGLKYNFNIRKKTIYTNAGVAYNLYFTKKLESDKALVVGQDIFLSSEQLPFELAPLNIWFGIGYALESVLNYSGFVELKYELSEHTYQSSESGSATKN